VLFSIELLTFLVHIYDLEWLLENDSLAMPQEMINAYQSLYENKKLDEDEKEPLM